jgi:SAM-dependent methyltransferase
VDDIRVPEWQLPQGVPRGAWEYARTEHIATEYDEYFAASPLFEFDEQVLARHFTRPGLVVDLGCGTGRALVPLARRGFRCLGVDLSPHMLRIVGEKAAFDHLPIWRLCSNLVELNCLRECVADYAVCLFSTIGMIRLRENRRRVLEHAYRVLKPGGLFVIHVHNFWFNLFSAEGRRYLVRHLWESFTNRDLERGDKFFSFHGIPKMYLHTFGERELRRAVGEVGFHVEEMIRLAVDRQRPLPAAWLFGSFRANGWIAVCRKRA